MTKINYFDVLIWLVNIYALNTASQHIELWYAIRPMLSVVRAGLPMDDFNVCGYFTIYFTFLINGLA